MSTLQFRFKTYHIGGIDYRIRSLRDRQQYDDPEGEASRIGISTASWPLFGTVWPSGELLAHMMVDYEIKDKQILEVGCGIALASMVLSSRLANITATDIHPSVKSFLLENIQLNRGRHIPFVRTGWADKHSDLGRFNLIIGSDLLYEPDQAHLLPEFIEKHAEPRCEVLIIDPGRGLHPRFSINMLKLGFLHHQNTAQGDDQSGKPFTGQVLHYQR